MENNKYHILIVEDDKEIRDGVEIYLKNQGYQVWKAANGKEGLEIVTREEIHLAILDIMMPVMDGVTMLMKLREQNHEFPVIMLSAKSEEVDKIMGLNMGADDYVTKPFSPAELTARVDALMRRSGGGVVDAGEIDQPPFLLAYGNAFFGQGAVAQGFAHCAGGRALAHGGNTVTVFGSFGHKAREVIIRKRNMSQRIHSCDHLRSSLWNTDEFPASGLTLLPGSMWVSYS